MLSFPLFGTFLSSASEVSIWSSCFFSLKINKSLLVLRIAMLVQSVFTSQTVVSRAGVFAGKAMCSVTSLPKASVAINCKVSQACLPLIPNYPLSYLLYQIATQVICLAKPNIYCITSKERLPNYKNFYIWNSPTPHLTPNLYRCCLFKHCYILYLLHKLWFFYDVFPKT